jgi:lysophospholipase L1-like esterase
MNRWNRSLAATAALGLLLGVAAAAPLPASAESNGGVRIMPLGDSITDGITVSGAYRTTLWQRFTSSGARVDFVGSLYGGPSALGDRDHEGHSGWRIDQLDANITNWLRNTQPRTVLLHIGTNDMNQNYQVSSAPQRLSALIDKITAAVPGVHLFVATIIPASWSQQENFSRTYNAQIPGIVQAKRNAGKNVRLVDLHSALTTADLADGVHPNTSGYTKMANAWWAALQQDPSSYSDQVTTTTTTTRSTTTTTTRPTTTTTTTRPTSTTTTSTTTNTSTTTGSGATTTTGGNGGGCTAAYTVQNSWPGGFVGSVTVTAGASVSGWRVALVLPSGASLAGVWNGVATGSSGTVAVTNAAYNGQLGAGQSTTFGFQGNGSGDGATVSCTPA